jgi:hypothetical protein
MELRRWSPFAPQLVANLAVAADAKTILSLGSAVMTRPDIQSGGLATKQTTKLSLLDADTGRWERDLTLMGAPVAIAADPTEMVFAYFDQNEALVRSLSDRKAMFSDGLAQKAIRIDGQGAFKVFFSPDGALLFAVNA